MTCTCMHQNGYSKLSLACMEDRRDQVEMLLANGASPILPVQNVSAGMDVSLPDRFTYFFSCSLICANIFYDCIVCHLQFP
jgi:hypothetical protein